MSQENIFSNGSSLDYGIGYHNVGTVLRGSNPVVSNAVNARYGARLGHLPPAKTGHFALMSPEVQTQTNLFHLQYLSLMYGVDIKAITPEASFLKTEIFIFKTAVCTHSYLVRRN